MKTVIIEDEKPSARRLQRMLGQEGIETQVMLHSVEESVDWFQNNPHPDLIFLDIQLSDGLSFEIFDAVDIRSSVIFTTAYDEYALQAFKLNSIDYLLKPIDPDELRHAINQFNKPRSKTFYRSPVQTIIRLCRPRRLPWMDRVFRLFLHHLTQTRDPDIRKVPARKQTD